MSADITQHPACPPVNALNCVDNINLSIEHAIGNVELLRTVLADTRQPVPPRWLYSAAAHLRIEADDIALGIDLWRRVPVAALPDADCQAIERQLAAVIRHVEGLERCADHAASVQVDRDFMLAIVGRLLAALKTLARRAQAAWTACQPPAPAA